MKTYILIGSTIAIIGLSGCACDDCRPGPSNSEKRESHMRAANEAEKSFDKEAPATPAAADPK